MNELENYFKEYSSLMEYLSTLISSWAINYSLIDDQIFRENYLKEKIIDQEKKRIREKNS